MFALNLGEDGRVLSATFDLFAPEKQPRTPVLPQGNLMDYRFEDGGFVYDPLPEEQTPAQPTTEDRLHALEEENQYLKETLEIILSGETQEEADGEPVEEEGV